MKFFASFKGFFGMAVWSCLSASFLFSSASVVFARDDQKSGTEFPDGNVAHTNEKGDFLAARRPEDTLKTLNRDSSSVLRDRLIAGRVKRENLTSLGDRVRDPARIDTMRGLSAADKAFLRRRYQILHPLD